MGRNFESIVVNLFRVSWSGASEVSLDVKGILGRKKEFYKKQTNLYSQGLVYGVENSYGLE